ncbi:MAG TPA: GtrA family protein [Acidimicrobiales bacterium]|nr:GtrA family protein [Acidimicrobiales bacterium]
MALSFDKLRALAREPKGKKAIRYTMVSVISVAVNQLALFLLFTVFKWTATSANILACVIAGLPSYYLNRAWAWGKTGRSHLMKEVLPFWALAFLGLVFSTWAAHFAETKSAEITDVRLYQGLAVNFATIVAYGVLWIGKFVIFNKWMFGRAHHDGQQVSLPARPAG